jgi:phage-related tail protein
MNIKEEVFSCMEEYAQVKTIEILDNKIKDVNESYKYYQKSKREGYSFTPQAHNYYQNIGIIVKAIEELKKYLQENTDLN